MTRTLRIALVDDQDLVRSGFRMILDAQKDMCVVGQASDGVGVLPMVKATQPDIVLMDIRMPTLDGISATHAVLGSHPDLKVLILTTFDLDDYLVAAMRAGASGFLLKDSTAPELLAGIRAVGHAPAADAVVRPHRPSRPLGARRRTYRVHRCSIRPGEGDRHAGRTRHEQRRDRPAPRPGRVDDQVPPQPDPAQAGAA